MNKKLTKLLSVFVIAGAIGTGTAFGLAGCGHKHTAADKWESNETQHWHECTANDGAKLDEGAHVDADNNGKCDVCDYQMSTPAVEYTVTFNANGHGTAPAAATTVDGKVTKPADLSDEDYDFGGWFTDAACTTEFDFNTVLTANTTLYAKWTEKAADLTPVDGVVSISSVKQFLAFRQLVEIPEDVTEYQLAADIDLAGVKLEAPAVVLTAGKTFNGAGYTIKNASYTEAGSKEGIVFKTILGGTVTDVKFLGCSIVGTSESTAILAGECNGDATLSKIEFNSCTVTAAGGGYGGLLFARNEGTAGTINISEITAKNGCKVTTPKYGGLLVGDAIATTTINLKDIDIDGELATGDANGAFLLGRSRNGAVSVENAVIRCKTSSLSPYIFVGGSGNPSSLTIKNVLIVETNAVGIVKGTPKDKIIQKLYAVSGITIAGAEETAGENTVAFLSDTLGLDFAKVWKAEGENNAKYRLKCASTNVKSADATITELKVSANSAKTRFKKGEEFTAEGLNVMGVYSDGVQLVLKADEGYEVDASAFNKDAAGEYTITVKSKEDATKTGTYKVTVAEETGFEIIDNHMDHVYLVGDSLDTANLVVKSIWSDGIKEKLAAKEYTIDATSYDMTTAGAYEVSITHGTYAAQKIKISVLNSVPQPVDGKVYVNVDASATQNGALVNGVETFTSVKDAINFYETIGYEKEVVKVINVGEGTFTDKITTALDNLVLVGKGTDKSILTYSAVESTVDPVSGSQYGVKCATLHVQGSGFRAYNIAIRNDFDYKNDNAKESSPQGLALTIEGDQAVLQNVYLYGNQDTLYLKKGRTYIKDSKIDGNIDFIFGEATGLAFFDNCTIKAINKSNGQEANNGYVTAMKADATNKPDYGYIFSKCTFTDDGTLLEGSMSLGRPWGPAATVAYIECSFTKAYSKLGYTADDKTKSRWFSMSGNSPVNADFCEYGSTGEGAITEAVAGGSVLTAEQAANYTKANIFAKENGLCKWDAAWDCDAAVTELATLVGGPVAATEIYVSATSIEVDEGKEAALYIGTAPWNANDKSVTVTVADTQVATWSNGVLKGLKAGTTTITVEKTGMTSKTVAVTVKASGVTTTTYTYTQGGTNGDEWTTDATTTNASLDATPVTGLKILDTNSFKLTASAKKATIAMTGFTTASGNAQPYITVTFKDASGASLGTLTGTTTAGKLNGSMTFTSNGVFESATEFASIEISCNTAGKHFSIVSVEVVTETAASQNVLEKFFVTSDDAAITGATFSVDAPTAWDAKGIIKLYSATAVWSTDDNSKQYTDINGTVHNSVKRVKSNGASSYMTIDLTGYSGEYTLTFAYAPSNNNRTAQLAVEGETPVFTVDNTTDKPYVANATATLEGGKVYKFTWTNGYNFYYMGIVPKA